MKKLWVLFLLVILLSFPLLGINKASLRIFQLKEFKFDFIINQNLIDFCNGQFGKDVAGGVTNAFTNAVTLALKAHQSGMSLYYQKQVDYAKGWVKNKINKTINATEGSLMFWMGETYGPAGNYRVIDMELPSSVANNFMRWERLDGIVSARYAALEQLLDYMIRLII